MNTAIELTRTLVSVAGDIAFVAKRLLALLESERIALIAGDNVAIDIASANKQTLLQQIECLDDERRHLLASINGGYQVPFTMERELAHNAAALAQWRETEALLSKCQQLNQANGSVVELRIRHVRKALDLLSGNPAQAELYGPQGARESLRNLHPFAKA